MGRLFQGITLCSCPCREVKCEPFDPRDAAKHRDVRCRYKANAFGIGLKHTAFFLQNKTCLSSSSVQHKTLHLLQHREFNIHSVVLPVAFK